MGKKKKKFYHQPHSFNTAVSNEAVEEKMAIKKDLVQTVVVNLIFLVVLFVLFYWNQKSGQQLDRLITDWIRL